MRAASPRGAFAVGWAAGAGFFGAGLFWIVDPFLVQPEIFGWMAPFAVTGMAGGLALFWAVPFALARALRPPGLARVLALAALWALSDYARAHVLTGFPWALAGLCLGRDAGDPAGGAGRAVPARAPDAGRGDCCRRWGAGGRWRWPPRWWPRAGGSGAWRLAQPLPVRAEPLVVRLVQPNAVQAEKWLPGKEQEFWDRHIALTRAPADPRPDIVIWSETAAPFALGTRPDLQAEAAAAAAAGAARHRHRAGGGGGGGRAVLQLARGPRRGRERGRGLRQAPPCPVRRIHPALPGRWRGSGCRRWRR